MPWFLSRVPPSTVAMWYAEIEKRLKTTMSEPASAARHSSSCSATTSRPPSLPDWTSPVSPLPPSPLPGACVEAREEEEADKQDEVDAEDDAENEEEDEDDDECDGEPRWRFRDGSDESRATPCSC